jgi:diguanylate cyclase (GGDEF)-like protein
VSALVLGVIRLHTGPLARQDIVLVMVPSAVLSLMASAFALIAVLLLNDGPIGTALVVVFIGVGTWAYRGHLSSRRRLHALTLVHEFVTDGVGAESMEALADQLLSRIRRLLRATTAELVVIEEASADGANVRRAAEPTSSSALTLTIGEDELLVVGRGDIDHSDWAVVRALSQQEPMLAARNSKDQGIQRWLVARGLRDALMVALPTSSGSSGTLMVMDRLGETATFTDDDLTLLQTLAGHLAVAIRSTRLVERLGYDATHDPLTGLTNRAYLSDRIEGVIATATGDAAVLMLDLDRFKEVNDMLGHDVGDRLLMVVADRLRQCVPADATVARLGGDEFAILLSDLVGGADTAVELAERVAEALAQPVHFDDALLTPEASVGVAVTTRRDPKKDLLRQADTAMYAAKASDRRVAIYGSDMDRGRGERLALLADLRIALTTQQEQLVMVYQPKVDLATGEITSAEALVRWNHPTLGVVAPDRFVPLAESTGLIEHLTPLVLDLALKACRSWTLAGSPITVAVNLSARNVSDPQLPARVADALARTGVPASQLILEITESSVMGDPEQTLPVLQQLHDLGICLSVDDFGTGYSSLSYLQRLPIDEVKIDSSFALGLTGANETSSRALIRSIAGLGANLGLRIVAEGVEDQATLDEVRELGCNIAQGYHISWPLSEVDFRAWLARESRVAPRLRLLRANP